MVNLKKFLKTKKIIIIIFLNARLLIFLDKAESEAEEIN